MSPLGHIQYLDKTCTHTQPIYRGNFIPAGAKIILCCLFYRVFRPPTAHILPLLRRNAEPKF